MSGQERAEEKPREPEEGFSAILELASVGAVLGDAEGRILRVNPKTFVRPVDTPALTLTVVAVK